MPIYEYQCPVCGLVLEIIKQANEKPPEQIVNKLCKCCIYMDKIISVPGYRRDQTIVGE